MEMKQSCNVCEFRNVGWSPLRPGWEGATFDVNKLRRYSKNRLGHPTRWRVSRVRATSRANVVYVVYIVLHCMCRRSYQDFSSGGLLWSMTADRRMVERGDEKIKTNKQEAFQCRLHLGWNGGRAHAGFLCLLCIHCFDKKGRRSPSTLVVKKKNKQPECISFVSRGRVRRSLCNVQP